MDSPTQDKLVASSPDISQPPSTRPNVPSSSYLTVPSTKPPGLNFVLPGPAAEGSNSLDSSFGPKSPSTSLPEILEPPRGRELSLSRVPTPRSQLVPHPELILMSSVHSSASIESGHSAYSNPPARLYRVPSFQTMAGSQKITITEKDQMIQALRSHQINTLVELRRVEKAFAVLGSPDVTEPMTAAWSYYVNSHSLLTELRGLTKNYPFSSECLEEAKRRVYSDPQSNRSWNFCWLVLSKIQSDQLIPYYAQYQASQPAMWGGRAPTSESTTQLSNAFTAEWNWAIGEMLRHWDRAPTTY